MGKIPANVQKILLKRFHIHQEMDREDAEVNELNSIWLQISLSAMLIFMIAFFLFMSKIGGELDMLDSIKKSLERAEQDRVTFAVKQVLDVYRTRYGLKDFLKIDPQNGEKKYEFENVIQNGQILASGHAAYAFKTGMKAAAEDYSHPDKLKESWMQKIKSILGDSWETNQRNSEVKVDEQIQFLKNEVIEVQTLAASQIQQYLSVHPEIVTDSEIENLISRIRSQPDSPDQVSRIKELNFKLRKYVYSTLNKQCG